MRTTVTLDDDVVRLLHEAMHRSRRSFRAVLNDSLRQALARENGQAQEPFVIEARDMGLRPGIDPAGFNQLVDDLEADALVEGQTQDGPA